MLAKGKYNSTSAEKAGRAVVDAKVSAVIVFDFSGLGWKGSVRVDGETVKATDLHDIKSSAVAEGKLLAKRYGVELLVID